MPDKDCDDETVASEGLDDRDEIMKIRSLVDKQTTTAMIWRTLIIFVFQVTSTFTTVFTYLILDRENIRSFQRAVNRVSRMMEVSTIQAIDAIFLALADTNSLLSVYAEASQSEFPYVTIPNFEGYVKKSIEQTAAEVILYAPFVNNVSSWEQYSRRNLCFEMDTTTGVTVYSKIPFCLEQLISYIGNGQSQLFYNVGNETTIAPIWQVTPMSFSSMINTDVLSLSETANDLSMGSGQPSLGEAFNLNSDLLTSTPRNNEMSQQMTTAIHPMEGGEGLLMAYFSWPEMVSASLHGYESFNVFLQNTCGQQMQFKASKAVDGITPGGSESLFNDEFFATSFDVNSPWSGGCQYHFSLRPTRDFWQSFETNVPFMFAMLVAITSITMAITFHAYDAFLQKISSIIIREAARSNCIVSSVFPSNVRARLFGETIDQDEVEPILTGKQQLKSYLLDGSSKVNEKGILRGKPIADLFPETTVLFADLVGFTAWSSVREPFQVFTLLETVYYAFDQLAKARKIFKVETVGDCYVAVAGVPDPRPNHAVVMARFARDCMTKIRILTKSLEVTLGPDTGELTIRVGLHSGPVTAGVLRGERSRFQLFGDTMNTASRMESTGVKDRIQLSSATALLLIEAGKEDWLVERNETVVAKGKGELKTFFLKKSSDGSGADLQTLNPRESFPDDDWLTTGKHKTIHLIDWNVEILENLLKQVVAGRCTNRSTIASKLNLQLHSDSILDELQEVIEFPGVSATRMVEDPSSIPPLPDEVHRQLREFIAEIATRYKSNPFHSFEHASHVAMSVAKLMSRIVAPSDTIENNEIKIEASLHDPLTRFACAFSAVIHDVDHRGVPNSQLVAEDPVLAQKYKGKSPAEQNSIELALNMLCQGPYRELRNAIFSNTEELQRFRQLVVNCVLATDIMDKDLKALRNNRWDKAFAKNDDSSQNINRKATIVIEHLIQASDVAHTMQHWLIFRKWNRRLFLEMKLAYHHGRAEKDPAEFWYEGELGFFDFYILPLARKLKACGVFGVSSDEYLNYATANRKEWEEKGRDCVEQMEAEFVANQNKMADERH